MGVGIGGTLNVDGETRISEKLFVGDDVADGEFVATFINTNSGDGDGIKIKLGKLRSDNGVPPIPNLLSSAEVDQILDLISCEFPAANKPNLLLNIVLEGVAADFQMLGGLALGMMNFIIEFINAR